MTVFLATTGLTETWDWDDEILLLGRTCLRFDRRHDWSQLKWKVLDDPWEDPKKIDEASAYCEGVVDEVVVFLAGALNQMHGTAHSRRYWSIILRPWVSYLVHAAYDHYVALNEAVARHGALTTAVVRPEARVTPLDTLDFARLGFTDEFHLQLYSQLLAASGLTGDVICRPVDLDPRPAAERLCRTMLSTTSRRKQWRRRIAARITTAAVAVYRPDVLLGRVDLRPSQLVRLMVALAWGGRALPCVDAIRIDRSTVDAGRRSRLEGFGGEDGFRTTLGRILPATIPMLAVEAYRAYRRACVAMWPRRPKVVMSSSDWYFNEAFKFLAAEHGERGARLVGLQHGGGYGMSAVLPQEQYETAITDRWLSFGWPAEPPDVRVRPLVHPRFRVIRGVHDRDELLLVCTSYGRYVRRFESYHFKIGDFTPCLEWRETFVRTLPPAVRERTVIRLDGEDLGWGQAERLTEACGAVRFDDGRQQLRRRLAAARVVVLEYAGTAFLEALAADVPTIAYWDTGRWRVRRSAAPYLQELQDAKILFSAPDSAARWAAHIYNRPDRWWRDRSVQRARRAFVERYARGGDAWLAVWTAMFRDELLAATPAIVGGRSETLRERP